MESACMSMARTLCSGEKFDNCVTSNDEKCTEASNEDCTTSVTYVDKVLTFNKCNVVYNNFCKKVPKRDCRIEKKEVCPECKTVSTEKCSDEPRNVCKKVPKTVDKVVPKRVCNKVCQPRKEKSCTYPEPKMVCTPVTKFNSYQVPISKCS